MRKSKKYSLEEKVACKSILSDSRRFFCGCFVIIKNNDVYTYKPGLI